MSTFHFRGHRFWHESKCTRTAAAAIVLLALSATAKAQRVELLWPDGAPGAVGTEDRDRPSIGIYLPAAELGASCDLHLDVRSSYIRACTYYSSLALS